MSCYKDNNIHNIYKHNKHINIYLRMFIYIMMFMTGLTGDYEPIY